jgi:hypothetical protein
LLIPTDDPRFAGLTKQGKPSSAARRAIASGVSTAVWATIQRQSGRPASRKSDFIAALSIPVAEARTPAPT